MTIGEKIKDLRTKKGLSMKQLSEKSGLSLVTICAYETEKRTPRLSNINKLAKALGCSFDDLYNLLNR